VKVYSVVFSPEAETQIVELYRYIAAQASAEVAARFTDDLVACCERLRIFPHRGVNRDDIRPGLRLTNHKKRTAIAFLVEEGRVVILGVFYGGRNYDTVLSESEQETE
jgi:toxin ParE1/3/4